MKDPPYIFACFSKLKDKENRQKHMADPLKCKNVLLNMCFKFSLHTHQVWMIKLPLQRQQIGQNLGARSWLNSYCTNQKGALDLPVYL